MFSFHVCLPVCLIVCLPDMWIGVHTYQCYFYNIPWRNEWQIFSSLIASWPHLLFLIIFVDISYIQHYGFRLIITTVNPQHSEISFTFYSLFLVMLSNSLNALQFPC